MSLKRFGQSSEGAQDLHGQQMRWEPQQQAVSHRDRHRPSGSLESELRGTPVAAHIGCRIFAGTEASRCTYLLLPVRLCPNVSLQELGLLVEALWKRLQRLQRSGAWVTQGHLQHAGLRSLKHQAKRGTLKWRQCCMGADASRKTPWTFRVSPQFHSMPSTYAEWHPMLNATNDHTQSYCERWYSGLCLQLVETRLLLFLRAVDIDPGPAPLCALQAALKHLFLYFRASASSDSQCSSWDDAAVHTQLAWLTRAKAQAERGPGGPASGACQA